MDPERLRKIEELYEAALEVEPARRATFLAENCAGDEAVRREVESLLLHDDQTGSFLQAPALQMLPGGSRLTPGQHVSHYEIVEKLGEGGMGVVYKAYDTALGRTVALKFLSPQAVGSDELKSRFLHEARAAAALDHPAICAVYEVGEAEGQSFLAMAYIDGPTLRRKIDERPLKLEEALDLAIQVGEGLAAAHEKGIIHRDIKSANILLTNKGQAKITDFGLAQLGGETKLTRTGAVMGTPAYMSPEQARGEAADRRSDIWSLGVVLYEMIAGRLPFQGEQEQAVLHGILEEEPEPLTAVRSRVPVELDHVIEKALAKSPHQRYQHIEDMVVDLRRLRDRLPTRTPHTPLPATRQRRVRRPALVLLAGFTVLVAAGAAFWIARHGTFQGSATQPPRIMPLTSYKGSEEYATFSPDGNQVAFSWNGPTEDNYDIYVKLIDSVTPLRLTTNPEIDTSPVWAPDGRSIAFIRHHREGQSALVVVPAIGGTERVLREDLASLPDPYLPGRQLAWSPDGRWIVACRDPRPDSGGTSLFLVSSDSGETRRLTSPPREPGCFDSGPALSPDGRFLAFVRRVAFAVHDIYVAELDINFAPKQEPKRRTFLEKYLSSPVWTPDGRQIIFAEITGGTQSLWRVRVFGGGDPQRLASVGFQGTQPALSPRGGKLAFTSSTVEPDIWRMTLPGPLNSPGLSSTPPEEFIASTRKEENPQYSPDGRYIAYESNVLGRSGVWVCNADGSNAIELFTRANFHSGTPRWSPDGQRLVFDSNAEGSWDIYLIGARGGQAVRVTANPADDYCASWSRDGRWIYFFSNRGGAGEIWKMPAAASGSDRDAVQVTRHGAHLAFESGDGRYLYYTKSATKTGLWRMPVDGGEETELLPSIVPFNFAVVDGGVYYQSPQEADGTFGIWFYGTANGTAKKIAKIAGIPAMGITVSPDGRSILYARSEQLGSDLMLVEGFR